MNKTEEENYIEKGDALYKENLYREAIAEYNNALQINPGNLVTQLKIAKAKLSENNLKGPAVTYDLEKKNPLAKKAPETGVTAKGPIRKRPSRIKNFVWNVIYITPALIIISFAVWYYINAKESRTDSVPSENTAGVSVKMSPEGADLIFGKKENPEPAKPNEPVKPDTGQKPAKRNRVDVAKKESAKKAGPDKPVTKKSIVPAKKERTVKEEKVSTTLKQEAENAEEPGFWATLKKYILSLFEGAWHQESSDKGVIRDPLGAEKK